MQEFHLAKILTKLYRIIVLRYIVSFNIKGILKADDGPFSIPTPADQGYEACLF